MMTTMSISFVSVVYVCTGAILLLITQIQGFTPPSTFRVVQQQQLKEQHARIPSAQYFALDTSSSLDIAAVSDLSLTNPDVIVFIAGLIPFGWATVEFWRRIAVGEPFGTGKDSVYIGKDNAPKESRGRQTLDRGAFIVAYILFGLAGGSIALTLYTVISSAPPQPEDLAAAVSTVPTSLPGTPL